MCDFRLLVGVILVTVLTIVGCSGTQTAPNPALSSNLGVTSRVDNPSAVAAARTFYVMPNDQLAMRNSFSAGVPLQQLFAAKIAEILTAKGLTQAPSDIADTTVSFVVRTPSTAANPDAGPEDTQSIGYADRLLAEAKSMQSSDNFLDRDRVDMRINMVGANTGMNIWHGAIAGVSNPGDGSHNRIAEMLRAVDRAFETYPKMQK